MADPFDLLFTTRGAVAAVARALGISQAAVSQWRQAGIPDSRRADVETALAEHLGSLRDRLAANRAAAPEPAQEPA